MSVYTPKQQPKQARLCTREQDSGRIVRAGGL